MQMKTNNYNLFALILTSVSLCFCFGCSPENADSKAEIDRDVYQIIDSKWDQSYGSKANYKISDTKPLPNDIQIERMLPEDGLLILPQAVAIATAGNRRYQFEKEQIYLKALDLRLARHDFDPLRFISATSGYSKDGSDELTSHQTAAGFSRLFANGARISANLVLAWTGVLAGNAGGGFSTVFGTTVTQPMLRGSSPVVITENLTQAQRDCLYQIRSFNRFRKTFVVAIISSYYYALQKSDFLKDAKENHSRLNQIYKRVEKLTNAGKLPKYQLEEIYHNRLAAQDAYIKAEKELALALDEFKIQLSLSVDTQIQLDDNELAALKLPETAKPDFSQQHAVQTALMQRLDLANSADAIDDAQRKVLVAADALGAEMNLAVTASIPASGLSSDTPIDEMFAAGLQLNLPLDRVAEQNIFRAALITHSQRQREFEQARDTIVLQVRQDYRNLTEAARLYKLQSEILELAKKRRDDTYQLLHYNRASTRDLIRAQEDLYEARLASTTAMIDYTIATLNFYCDTGMLQVRPDGMWQAARVAGAELPPEDLTPTEGLSVPETETRQPVAAENYIKGWMKKAKAKYSKQ